MTNIYIITITDKQNYYKTENLKKSLNNFKNFIILDTYDWSIKNLSKIYKIYEFLVSNNDILENDIVCIIDGHDVLFNSLKSIENLKNDFIQTNTDIIFSTETKFSHHELCVKPFFDTLCKINKNKYLNSGCVIAYKYVLCKIYNDIILNIIDYNISKSKSDQRILSLYLLKYHKNIKFELDYNNLFCTTVNTNYNQNLEDINSYFIHVTYLSNSNQYKKFKLLCQLHNIN